MLIPIPPEFYDEETDAPFERCGLCECELLVPGAPEYVVEKAVRQRPLLGGREVIFAHAICVPCSEATSEGFSEESEAACQAFFEERLDPSIVDEAVREADMDLAASTSVCACTGRRREELEEYQTIAYGRGLHLVAGFTPLLLSGEVMDDLLPLLSEATRDELGGLRNRLNAPPPTERIPLLFV